MSTCANTVKLNVRRKRINCSLLNVVEFEVTLSICFDLFVATQNETLLKKLAFNGSGVCVRVGNSERSALDKDILLN